MFIDISMVVQCRRIVGPSISTPPTLIILGYKRMVFSKGFIRNNRTRHTKRDALAEYALLKRSELYPKIQNASHAQWNAMNVVLFTDTV